METKRGNWPADHLTENQFEPDHSFMQSKIPNNTVFDLGDTKQAAIFFDHVIPLEGVEGFRVIDVEDPDMDRAKEIVRQLAPRTFADDQEADKFASAAVIGRHMMAIASEFFDCKEVDDQVQKRSQPYCCTTLLS